MFIGRRGLATLCSMLLALPAFVAAQRWDSMPLQSSNPDRPVEVLADRTWLGADLRAKPTDEYFLGTVEHKPGKGPLTVVVDYMATREGEAEGKALVNVYLWCNKPSGVEANQWHVIGFETGFMSQGTASLSGKTIPVWAARQSRGFLLEDRTHCNVELSFKAPQHLETEAVRARLVYGEHANLSLAGQPTRGGLLLKVLLSFAAVAAVVWWVARRD